MAEMLTERKLDEEWWAQSEYICSTCSESWKPSVLADQQTEQTFHSWAFSLRS